MVLDDHYAFTKYNYITIFYFLKLSFVLFSCDMFLNLNDLKEYFGFLHILYLSIMDAKDLVILIPTSIFSDILQMGYIEMIVYPLSFILLKLICSLT